MSDDLKARKIMPLNQTAHADVVIKGNPVTTRPDATVENTFPGLEFDHRNLEKQFLDGLLIEFHASSGGWLRDYDRQGGLPITEADFNSGLMVWAILGNQPELQSPEIQRLAVSWIVGTAAPAQSVNGSSIWQIVREFEPGPAAVVLGPQRAQLSIQEQTQINQALANGQSTSLAIGGSNVSVVYGIRSEYLKDGVIDTEKYEPGDLTRSLCSPWQYDFTDCGCWYWASNKPDMVSVSEEGPQIYNFQRVRTAVVAPEPPQHPPVVEQRLWRGGHEQGTVVPEVDRVPRQMNHAELILGWESLPVVINDRETEHYVELPDTALPASELFPDLPTIIDRLSYLAEIEHALMIEYLYAYYSIDSPVERPEVSDVRGTRLYEAAQTVLSVAIDEMRHFRWANEILVLLGHPPVISRAARTADKDGNGRYLPHEFELTAATRDQINWFIQVEANSQSVDTEVGADTIDGMYTRLYLSIERSDEIPEEIKDRVLHLIKLIIDEGYEHYHRFQRVGQLLPQPPDQSYLRLDSIPVPLADVHAGKSLELRVDRSYEVVLNLLLIVFGRGNSEHGQLLEATRIAMVDSLDVEARALIELGGAPLFSSPTIVEDLTFGRFTSAPDPENANAPIISWSEASPLLDLSLIMSNATAPLDRLNIAEMNSDDTAIQSNARRSQDAMTRVRNAFISVMSNN